MTEQTLNDLSIGDSALVLRINCQGAMKRRLIDMGITPGVRVKLYKIAPMGDPLELKLRGYVLSIRRSEAKNIIVEKEPE
ncbi:MAG: ferrous iron transport protein A [Oscillospiraceae bacterium]